jgi:hypothetical protein
MYFHCGILETYYLFFKLHEIINKHVLAINVCYYSFCNEILMIHVFFQRYKYFLKDILLLMYFLGPIHHRHVQSVMLFIRIPIDVVAVNILFLQLVSLLIITCDVPVFYVKYCRKSIVYSCFLWGKDDEGVVNRKQV